MKTDEKDPNVFLTSDLPLITSLVSLRVNYTAIDTSNPSRAIFAFSNSDNLKTIVSKFWKGELIVEPKSFCSVQRELKARIRNEVEG